MNEHFERVVSYIERKAKDEGVRALVVRTCRNAAEYDTLWSMCGSRAGQKLSKVEEDFLKETAAQMFEDSIVEDISGFLATEPSPDEMRSIRSLFYRSGEYLGYTDKSLQPLEVMELQLETTFCSDVEVPLEPWVQLDLFGEEET